MTAFQAFAPIPQETTINGSAGRLVLASDDEKILISGDIEIAANETGLAAALHLRDMLNAVIDNISGRTSGNLSIEPPVSPIKKKNPFDKFRLNSSKIFFMTLAQIGRASWRERVSQTV